LYDWTRSTLGQKTNTVLISMRCSAAVPERGVKHTAGRIAFLPAGMESGRNGRAAIPLPADNTWACRGAPPAPWTPQHRQFPENIFGEA